MAAKVVPFENDIEANIKNGQVEAPPERPFPKLGITLKGIYDFIDRCGGREVLSYLSTSQVCEKFVKPMTKVRILIIVLFPINLTSIS